MDFLLNDDQRAVQKLAFDFAQKEIAPYAREHDEKGTINWPAIKKMGELGLLGGPIPEEYGGSGFDYIAWGLICEELERAETAFRVIQSVHVGLNSMTLLQWGTEEQKRRYLIPQARGEKLATFGLTEPGAGSDAGNIATTARKDGDYYILNGTKIWISLADVADHFLVFASLDRSKKHHGMAAFILERGMEGLSTATIHGKLGIRAGNTGEIIMQDVRVHKSNRVGEEGEGFQIAMSALDWGRYTVATGAVGLAQACLDASVKYASERHAFDRPIGKFQLVQQMIARMVAGIETARLLCYRVGWMKNYGMKTTRETSLAKWYACNVAFESANDAIEIHGAYGYSSEYPVERYMRNSRGAVIYEGTREIHTVLQGEYALGYRVDKPYRCPPPPAVGYERRELPDAVSALRYPFPFPAPAGAREQ
jgi:glutaryl-CoA dehydrogenase (non-decarboxylating)